MVAALHALMLEKRNSILIICSCSEQRPGNYVMVAQKENHEVKIFLSNFQKLLL